MEIKDKELHRIAITAIIYNQEGKFLITRRSLKKKAFRGNGLFLAVDFPPMIMLILRLPPKLDNGITRLKKH